ncbi:hypothetical protein CANCADRAFT_2038 [Tortispora caseinolytica NRRL Y-17796]|uniref:PROP1-like PPR domain-containing protein n=1 Tax=Tortispora caseinolytica NRRL Y-17796 TaxID=767744 RepID=A0A1E4TF22_9ASCO|nr:hypothetical protein CANCADRAFT_2038 [Tortispora caseinolytica NRRL Y-17796]
MKYADLMAADIEKLWPKDFDRRNSLVAIRNALDSSDPVTACMAIAERSNDNDFLRFLRESGMHTELVNYTMSHEDNPDIPSLTELLEEFAAHSLHEIEHWISAMYHYSKIGHPDIALDLFQRHRRYEESKREKYLKGAASGSRHAATVLKKMSTGTFYSPLSQPALVAYIIECMQKSVEPNAADAHKIVNMQVYPEYRRVINELQRHGFDFEYAEKVAQQLRALESTFIDTSSAAYLDRIRNLSFGRNFNAVDENYSQLKLRNYKMTPAACLAYMSGFLTLERPDMTFNVWKENEAKLFSEDSPADVAFYEVLLMATAKSASTKDELRAAWDNLLRAGYSPTISAYDALISGLFKIDLVQEALAAFEEMQNSGLSPSQKTFNIVLGGLLKHDMGAEAENFLEEGQANGYTADPVTCNAFLSAYLANGKYEGVLQMFDQMLKSNVKPDAATYTIIVDCLFKQASARNKTISMDDISVIIDLMNSNNVTPPMALYSAIIDGFTEANNIVAYKGALNLYNGILAKGLKPNHFVFSSITKARLKYGTLNEAEEVIKEMEQHKVTPLPSIYNQFLSYLSRRDRLDMDHAMDIYRTMLSRDCRPNKFTYFFLLKIANMTRSISDAETIVKDMQKRHFTTTSDPLVKVLKNLQQLGADISDDYIKLFG